MSEMRSSLSIPDRLIAALSRSRRQFSRWRRKTIENACAKNRHAGDPSTSAVRLIRRDQGRSACAARIPLVQPGKPGHGCHTLIEAAAAALYVWISSLR
jgi:hypothetical protein